jgi:hypothetical protein
MNLLPARSARDSTALYAEHALGLTRLAQVMLGDRPTQEYLRSATRNGPTSGASSMAFEAKWAAPAITGIGSRFDRG